MAINIHFLLMIHHITRLIKLKNYIFIHPNPIPKAKLFQTPSCKSQTPPSCSQILFSGQQLWQSIYNWAE